MRAITAFSEAVSSRRWKPRRREELRSEWHAATAAAEHHNSNSGDSDDEYDSDDARAMLTIEASYSSVASDASSVGAAYRSSGVVRTPSSVTSSLVLLEYPSLTHAGSASNVLSASSVYSSDDEDEDASMSTPRRGHQPLRHARVATPLLYPVLVVPQHVPRATEIQLFLSRIECVEITSVVERDDNVVYYVLDVYRHRQQNGIPNRHRRGTALAAEPLTSPQQRRHCSGHRAKYSRQPSSASASCSNTDAGSGATETPATRVRKPDYQIEHRYSSFARLRSHVWHIARKRHRRGAVCAYCDALVAFFSASDAQPSLRVKFTTNTEMRKALLRQFINDLLAATRADCSACTRSHRGVHPIPLLMKRFFHEQTGENFFS